MIGPDNCPDCGCPLVAGTCGNLCEIMNAPIAFGLKAQGHIPTIERMLAAGQSWGEIAKAIGWCEVTAREHYERHIMTTNPNPAAST